MTKTWQTKKKILRLVGKEAKTPGEISEKLGLAPSTVSEHLEELEKIGAINRVSNPYVKKWKYYKQNPRFDAESISELKRTGGIPQIAAALVVTVGLIALLAIGLEMFASGALATGGRVTFWLTDPPQVPNGTTALNITYSSLQAHVINGNASGWISTSGSGALNLMGLINVSQALGSADIPKNATVDMVSFAITSAKIVINGTSYNVTVPSERLTTQVTGATKANANSSILIDMSPVVATIYTENSTVFVLVPSVKAVVLGNSKEPLRVGERSNLSRDEQDRLSRAVPNISITSANLTVVENSTTGLSVTVKNDANRSVVIRHIILYGTPAVFVSDNDVRPMRGNNESVGINIESRPGFSPPGPTLGPDMGAMGMDYLNDTILINGTGIIKGVHVMAVGNGRTGMKVSPMMGDLVRVGEMAKQFRTLNFIVTSNGTLILPFMGNQPTPMAYNGSGYVLQPGASETFTFSEQMVFANGHMRMTPVTGEKFRLIVGGEMGVFAETNVTAANT